VARRTSNAKVITTVGGRGRQCPSIASETTRLAPPRTPARRRYRTSQLVVQLGGVSVTCVERRFCARHEAENEAPNAPLRDALVVLRLGTIILGADDVDRAAAFWAGVLGYEVIRFPGSSDDFTILIPPDRVGTRIAVHRSATPVQERPRVHLDLVVDSPAEQSSEVDRLVELGATRVSWDYPRDADFVVLADTEGNRFCIVDASLS
jgi:catechol 2,3-dioxygenase-like lactoylglutathione lyase family enzyme